MADSQVEIDLRLVNRDHLVSLAEDVRMAPRVRAAAYRELEHRYGCDDCGAAPGRVCRPEYGCGPENRTVVETEDEHFNRLADEAEAELTELLPE